MKKSVEILGLPIISITEGRELGMSKTLLIDAKNRMVAAITIEDDDWYRGVKLIPYESVIAIGEDAVTITHSENILNLDAAGDYEQLLAENIRVIGTKAITKTGRIQGLISEVFIGDGGKIVKCEITTPEGTISEVAAENISIFGKQVTVVDLDAEKKNNPVTETPAFEPAFEPAQEVWTPPVVEEPVVEEPPIEEPLIETPPVEESPVELPPVEEPPAEISTEPVEILDTPTETPDDPAEILDASVEGADITNEIFGLPNETLDTPAETQAEIEESMTPEPAEEPAPEVAEEPFTPFTEEQPATEEAPAEEDQKIAAMTQQAANLKEALQKARAAKAAEPEAQPSQKKQVEKAVDERRRRVLLGKHATKTITAESGTVVVEAGAEVTEEVLQRARLSNKFIELSMNVQ